jgi:hypothetical protein
MNKPYLLLLLAPTLIFGGCSGKRTAQNIDTTKQKATPPIVQEQTGLSTTTKAQTTTTSTGEERSAQDFFAPVLKGDDIYCFDQKVGTHKNGRVYMKLNDKVISFVAPNLSATESDVFDIKDMTCESENVRPDDKGNVALKYSNFYYQGLEVSTKLYGPYSVYKSVETPEENNKITFRCDGSLAKTAETSGKYTKSEPYFDCQTNQKDFLEQFEFSGAAGHQVLTTGGDYGKYWQKIFIKRLAGLNYIFSSSVSSDYKDSWSSDSSIDKFKEMSSRQALDELLKNPKYTRTIALWKILVDSFRVETKDEFGLNK